MIGQFGLETVLAYTGHVQDNAEESVRRVLDVLRPGAFTYPLDNGAKIQVRVDIDRAARRATVDFTGTSAQLADNFNAPSAVCRAAVLYVFRTLVDQPIPMNEGCLKPIEIVIPDGLHAQPELSGRGRRRQRRDLAVRDRRALRRARRARRRPGHDEQLHLRQRRATSTTRRSAAAPAPGPDFDGTAAVHTHMTNSRLTDPEVLEWRYPVVLESHRINRGSGGAGRHRGGDGTIRQVRFLEPMSAALLSNHRTRRAVRPRGRRARRARPAMGRARRRHDRGAAGLHQDRGRPGDVFVIQTPAGGGFGASPSALDVRRHLPNNRRHGRAAATRLDRGAEGPRRLGGGRGAAARDPGRRLEARARAPGRGRAHGRARPAQRHPACTSPKSW